MNITESIFKAYDIRGISGEELTVDLANAVGRAVADFLPDAGPVIVGRDMRVDSNDLANAVIEGLTRQGRDVWDIGLVTTDMVYFAAGQFADETAGGVMVTASHNPGKYNGIKLVGRGSVPMGAANGLLDIKRAVMDDSYKEPAGVGTVTKRLVVEEWVEKILEYLEVAKLPKYRIAVDAGNGMAGAIFPALQERLPFEVEQLYFELDGTFPNHVANPHLVETLKDLSETIKKNKLDFGLAFDGDGDRGGIVDENGVPVPEQVMGALLVKQVMLDNPGATIVYDLRTSHIVRDTIESNGGTAIRSKVGNDSIKTLMNKHGAVLGIEASGHYYFKDARKGYVSDSGIIAVMSVVNILAKSGKKMSELVKEMGSAYATAHEANFRVEDAAAVTGRLKEHFHDLEQDELDGLTVTGKDWWCNLRSSNTEPLVRLNVEARTRAVLDERLAEITKLIEG